MDGIIGDGGWQWVFVSCTCFLYSPLYFGAVAVWDNSITARIRKLKKKFRKKRFCKIWVLRWLSVGYLTLQQASEVHDSGTGCIRSLTWAPFHKRFFHRNSNSMEIIFHSLLGSNTLIATKFCTWHNSCAVVACAKICCDLMAINGITARRMFHRIWIVG